MGRDNGKEQKEGLRVQETVISILRGAQVSSAVRQQVNPGSGTGRCGALCRKRKEDQMGSPGAQHFQSIFHFTCLNITMLEGSVVVIFSLQMGEADSVSTW